MQVGGWRGKWQHGWPWHGAPGSDHLATPHGLRGFCDSVTELGVLRGEGITKTQRKGWGPAALRGEQAQKELTCGSPSHVQWRVSGEKGTQRCV